MTKYQPHHRSAGFGIYTALPDLPKGWQWIQSPHSWLLAESPEGARYYVDFKPHGYFILSLQATATWWDYLRTLGELSVGQQFMDTRKRIYSNELTA